MRTSHRGPDSSLLKKISIMNTSAIIGFHRLAIMDLSHQGDQPFYSQNSFAVCNGEIYNHTFLKQKYKLNTKSQSDCSVILPLYKKLGLNGLVQCLDGDFAFIILDASKRQIHLGRDPVGVKPLYWGYVKDKPTELMIASEIKSILPYCDTVYHVPSGSTITFTYSDTQISVYYRFYWSMPNEIPMENPEEKIRNSLTLAVKKRLMTDRPFGLFLSGGLDSSLVASIVRKLLPDMPIQTFSIGMNGSPDLANARIVSDFLKTNHHEIYFTPEEGIAVIRDVIQQLETYDITTIRASIPQYLLSRWISKNTDIKVLLSGEGSDELFGGYLYFHKCPNNPSFEKETRRLISQLDRYDVLRTDRTTAGNGLEVRVPFLDRGFIKTVMTIPSEYKNPNARIEKWILRNAFSENYLPDTILWRTKDAFSDACGYDWIPTLRTYCENQVSQEEYNRREELYPHLTPTSREAFYYRKMFEEFYPNQGHLLQHYWLPQWTENGNEPSAKILKLL